MVKDIIITTQRNIKKYKLKKLNDVYKSKYPIVTFSKKMKKFDKKIKIFLRKKCIFTKMWKKYNFRKKIINKLYLSIKKSKEIHKC